MPTLARSRTVLSRFLVIALAAAALPACGLVQRKAVGMVASTLASSGDVFTRDDDLELVGDAIPFGLKLYESLLDSVPNHAPLLVATCSGFTQYAYAFIETDAIVLGEEHHEESGALRERALRLYLRGKAYCLRAMEVRWRGVGERLLADPAAALSRAERKDVEMLYWTAASWGAAISLGLDQPELAVDFPVVRALADRALALDETWSTGALHELMISLDSLPEALGGDPKRARQHFDRAVALQKGQAPGPYVALATGVSVPERNRAEFESLLKQAIAVDPNADPSVRLATLITQRRARALLDQVDTRFVQ